MKRYIGLRNIVTSKNQWRRLFFYEIDGHSKKKLNKMLSLVSIFKTSYVCYKTKNGFHLVGLTPINANIEGQAHDIMQIWIPEYFSGQTIRMSLKEGEKQKLIDYSFKYPYLERLAGVYIRRLNIKKGIVKHDNPPIYSCVFEKYWTGKIR